jgi:hypothetical protein
MLKARFSGFAGHPRGGRVITIRSTVVWAAWIALSLQRDPLLAGERDGTGEVRGAFPAFPDARFLFCCAP